MEKGKAAYSAAVNPRRSGMFTRLNVFTRHNAQRALVGKLLAGDAFRTSLASVTEVLVALKEETEGLC
jgi:hypothetical protein